MSSSVTIEAELFRLKSTSGIDLGTEKFPQKPDSKSSVASCDFENMDEKYAQIVTEEVDEVEQRDDEKIPSIISAVKPSDIFKNKVRTTKAFKDFEKNFKLANNVDDSHLNDHGMTRNPEI